MRIPTVSLSLLAILLSHVVWAQEPSAKIESALQAKLADHEHVDVIVLATEQLLPDRDAFARFTQENANAERRKLREKTIAQLKEMSARFDKRVSDALGPDTTVRPLWVVNAVAASLTTEQIEQLTQLGEVRFIYNAGMLPREVSSGEVNVVLQKSERSPFTLEDKRVPWNVEEIGARRVWEQLHQWGDGVVVGMFDAGVDYAHEDLAQNVWINSRETPNDGVDNDGNGLVDDYYGWDFSSWSPEVRARGARQHGTWTSGIVAGDGTGGIVTGIAPRAKIMPLRAQSEYASMRAFEYALQNAADVMNMSFSKPDLGDRRGLWRLASEQAVCAGLVLVSGAGNFQQNQPLPVQQRIPEGIPCVISVGGVNQERELVRFSSMGPVEWGSVKFYEDYPMPDGLVKPDVSAFPGPGFPLLSTDGSGYIDPNNRIAGNSLSGPTSSGVVALMFGADPDLPAWRVKEILEATAVDLGEPGKDNATGAGLIDAFAAVQSAIQSRPKGNVDPEH